MSITHLLNRYYRTAFFAALLTASCSLSLGAAAMPVDSIGVTYENGQKIIIHQLAPKETYFGLSRQYHVPVNLIIAANKNKALKVGDTVRIPIGSPQAATSSATPTATPQQQPTLPELQPGEFTQYKVGKRETLYTVSKRFGISVESIKRANGLTSDSIQVDAILKVPNKELPPPPTPVNEILVTDETETEDIPEIPANRYGIRELTERGVGVWIDDLAQEGGSMLALHKTAPIGTVVKITNPMTQLTTFAKVVGKFADTAETKNAIIVISKSAAALIGVLDRRFQVEIAYGAPNEAN
ncbi:LysM repeat-containing protein [Parapedobacter composti]|uniref:LysM repeat-containing protein n=1 Tax=Parapedobacter composti TaxID=623281 RepID=A0A1I1LJU7_9SPHI|nr:LysM peptidoglycan-binding domain-containing protein [Parapedobacter composti]SFC70613.1 LysM repeat-containing protein [Parapedobacter composti]